jgi:uncharacterized protein
MHVTASATLPFSLMAKPIGAVCNLNCTYCYCLEKVKLHPQNQNLLPGSQPWAMSEKLLETYIAQTK